MSAEATGWVWKHSPHKGHHVKFLIHLAVADVVNDAHDNQFWMSQESLASKVGASVRSVNGWFSEAVDSGLVQCVVDNSRAGKPNCYRFLMPQGGTQPLRTGYAAIAQGGTQPLRTELELELKVTTTSKEVAKNAEEETTAVASRVVAAWVDATGRDPRRVRVNAKRLREVKARMREGYTEGDLVAAARGIALSPWHMGDNPDRKRYDDLAVAIRDGERVEKFRDLFDRGGDVPAARSAVDRLVESMSSPGLPALPAVGGSF